MQLAPFSKWRRKKEVTAGLVATSPRAAATSGRGVRDMMRPGGVARAKRSARKASRHPPTSWGLLALGIAVLLWGLVGIAWEERERRVRQFEAIDEVSKAALPIALHTLFARASSRSEDDMVPFFVFAHQLLLDERIERCVVSGLTAQPKGGLLVQLAVTLGAAPLGTGSSPVPRGAGKQTRPPKWLKHAMRRAVGDRFSLVAGPATDAVIVISLATQHALGVLHFARAVGDVGQRSARAVASFPCCFWSIPLQCAGTQPGTRAISALPATTTTLPRDLPVWAAAAALVGDVPLLTINLKASVERRAAMAALYRGANGGTGPIFTNAVHYTDVDAILAISSATRADAPFTAEEAITLSHLLAAQRALSIVRSARWEEVGEGTAGEINEAAARGRHDVVLVLEDDCVATDSSLWAQWVETVREERRVKRHEGAPYRSRPSASSGVLRFVADALEAESQAQWGVLQASVMTFPRYVKRMKEHTVATCGRSFAMSRFAVARDKAGSKLWGTGAILWHTRGLKELIAKHVLRSGKINFALLRPANASASSGAKKQNERKQKKKKKRGQTPGARYVADAQLYEAVKEAYVANLPFFLPAATTTSVREDKPIDNLKWRIPVVNAWAETVLAQETVMRSAPCARCAAAAAAEGSSIPAGARTRKKER